MALDLLTLRRYAIARSLGTPETLDAVLARQGFVQADPIRAPARAQDLVLHQRVTDYRVGDLERAYPSLDVEEDAFVNYGFVTRSLYRTMHPRTPRRPWTAVHARRAKSVLAFIRERGVAHPRDVDLTFRHGKATNWFGGSSNASTQLLEAMHYRGMLRVARRDSGIRIYAVATDHEAHADPAAAMDELVDAVVHLYAPIPERTLSLLLLQLRFGVPHWDSLRTAALRRAKTRLQRAVVDGTTWFWPAKEDPLAYDVQPEGVRLLAPFDPVVWDRRRFELFWGWAYRFEAYTPAAKRERGYYALPLLWNDRVIGWANLSARSGSLDVEVGTVEGAPRSRAYRSAFDVEVDRMRVFLDLAGA